ncbi:MAG: dATP/dGTP pyrophosphohydrolase domain-containing protein [Pseudomonadota bacterium]
MSERETSASIAQWAERAFGPASDLTALVTRAEQELAELNAAILSGSSADSIEAEAADVTILLHRIVVLGADGELSDAVDAKMAINRSRKWQPAGNGTGKHIVG